MTSTAKISARPIKERKAKPVQTIWGEHTHVAGLDASTRNIGYCAPSATMTSIRSAKLPEHPTPIDLARRLSDLKGRFLRTMKLNPPMPTLVVYEGAFYAHANTSARLDELRGVLRDVMLDNGIAWVEVPPASLKLFACGQGNADKTKMTHAACSRIRAVDPAGRLPSNDDEADAWWLRRMGRVGLGLDEALARYETDAVESCGVRFPS